MAKILFFINFKKKILSQKAEVGDNVKKKRGGGVEIATSNKLFNIFFTTKFPVL